MTWTAPGDASTLVDVVDDEDEVAAELGLERLADGRREAPGARGLVLLQRRGRPRP